jgi:hypothetical protein
MDHRERIAVPGYFLFGAVAGLSLVHDETPDAIRGYVHAFQSIRGLAGFNPGNFQQSLKDFRRLPVEEFLPASELADGPQCGRLFGVEPEAGQELLGQGMHDRPRVAGMG